MKITSKLTIVGSIAAIVSSPLVLADDSQDATPDPAICIMVPPEPEVITEEVKLEDITEGGEVVAVEEEAVTDGEVGEVVDSGEAEVEVTTVDEPVALEDGPVPINWVKRGGGEGGTDNPEIYHNLAGGPAPAVEKSDASGALAHELGQDEKSTVIEAKANAATPQIKGDKKEPVALIKKGRVFLR